jgi:transcriptional regulator of arginine metabolism
VPRLREKERREKAIFRLIENRPIGTQSELVNALTDSGFDVTQATVSREVRRLGLVKKPLPDGGFRYSAPKAGPAVNKGFNFRSFVTGFTQVEAFCVLNTLPGRAMLVAVTIDELELPEIAGTLAGDDLVLVLVKKQSQKMRVEQALSELF